MDENQQPRESGWDFPKVVGLILGILGMVGFGVCTLCGAFLAVDYSDAWAFVLAGAVMTGLSIWLVSTMVRKAREARDRNNT